MVIVNNGGSHGSLNGYAKIIWWIVGSLFTLLLFTVGLQIASMNSQYARLESEMKTRDSMLAEEEKRISLLQSQRGERITQLEGKINQLDARIQRNADDIVYLRRLINPREPLP